MKSISTLIIIGLLFFACKLCSTTENHNRPIPSSTPTPRPLMYAADFLKPTLGSFTLMKRRNKEDLLKDAGESILRDMLEHSNDAGTASYHNEKNEPAILCVFSFSNPAGAASEFERFEKDVTGSYRWRNIKSTTIAHGKRIEATDSKSRAAIVWTNGYWLFWAWSGDPAVTNSLAESVGY